MLKSLALGTLALTFSVGMAHANDGPLTSELSSFVITVDADGNEVRTASEDVAPGQTVEYVLTYENVSEGILTGLVPSALVPADTVFVMDSAITDVVSTFEVSADDGATWGVPPLMTQTDAGEAAIEVSDYDLVRWVPENAIQSGETWSFTYRTSVE